MVCTDRQRVIEAFAAAIEAARASGGGQASEKAGQLGKNGQPLPAPP